MDKNNLSASENRKAEISKDLIALSENVTDLSEYFKAAFQRIRSDAEDVKCNMETGNTLKIGRESVQPLVELKNLAVEVFSDVKNNEVKCFNQEIDVTPIWIRVNEMKETHRQTRELINLLESLKDSTAKLIEQQKFQKQNTNADESCASSLSSASDPSLSEFSLFDNSAANAATSSPISKTNYVKKQEE